MHVMTAVLIIAGLCLLAIGVADLKAIRKLMEKTDE